MKTPLLQVGYDKNGEMDFSITATVGDLTREQLYELRNMIVVAIWCAEDMWRRNHQPEPGMTTPKEENKLIDWKTAKGYEGKNA